jgi:putative oxidoreductase
LPADYTADGVLATLSNASARARSIAAMKMGMLVVRLVVGTLFIGHGLQKLRGSFGGPGLEGTEKMMEGMDMHPPRTNAIAAGMAETAGGIGIAAGAATPLAAGGLISVMLTAVTKVHWKKGVWNSNGGFEYNAVLMSVLAMLAAEGPGPVSVDAIARKSKWGAWGGVTALVVGVGGAVAAMRFGAKNAQADDNAGADGGGAASEAATAPEGEAAEPA